MTPSGRDSAVHSVAMNPKPAAIAAKAPAQRASTKGRRPERLRPPSVLGCTELKLNCIGSSLFGSIAYHPSSWYTCPPASPLYLYVMTQLRISDVIAVLVLHIHAGVFRSRSLSLSATATWNASFASASSSLTNLVSLGVNDTSGLGWPVRISLCESCIMPGVR